jgi:hypothetical protein
MVEGKGDGLCPGFVGKWVERESGKNDLKSSSSLPLHAQGRRRTVPFKRHCFSVLYIFFLRKENVIWKNLKMGYDSVYGLIYIIFSFLERIQSRSKTCVKQRKISNNKDSTNSIIILKINFVGIITNSL